MPTERDIRAIREEDDGTYWRFTGPSRLDKSLHTLEGLLKGVAADGVITVAELEGVRRWMREHSEFALHHPFNEIIPFLDDVLADGQIDADEAADVLWLCERLSTSNEYFQIVTSDMQRFQGLLSGITADGQITEAELRALQSWMDEHTHLKTCWPYDEIESLVLQVLRDGRIDKDEHELLLAVFGEFAEIGAHRAVDLPLSEMGGPVTGYCAVCPTIAFPSKTFCFTGRSMRAKRRDFATLVEKLGGTFTAGVTKSLDYLIIGADGNAAWAYACYGRKVEQAVHLRKEGHALVIVHENDFWDAVADAGVRE